MATRARNGWTLVRRPAAAGGRRRGAAAAAVPESDIPPQFLQSAAIRIDEVHEAIPAPAAAARRGAPPDLVVEVDLEPGEASILAVRHPSGALSFHPSTGRVARTSRRGAAVNAAATPGTAVFRVAVRRAGVAAEGGGRRGLVTKALKVVVLKVAKIAVDKVVRLALPVLAAQWETRTWKSKGLAEGWFHVAPAGNAGLTLTPGTPPPGQRSLLLLHGTFSNANGAFANLTATDFFDRIRARYADRIYAFNHFSISRTPEENARMLLDGLPAGEHIFDVITHSRGGLVLRNLVERRAAFGAAANRFRVGHAVLVASPNDGTPLATPNRWEQTLGWFANLMEVFPDNPFTTGAAWISESLVWLASHAANDLPGLRAMDGAGELVAELQSPPGPPTDAYSALVSNFHPEDALWQRALDVGVDEFFGSANDLVVPSEGGWRTDKDGAAHVPAGRIGCFGPGGNFGTEGDGAVHHLNFFGRSETAQFLATALAGDPQSLPRLDPDKPLPDRRFTRGITRGTALTEVFAEEAPAAPIVRAAARETEMRIAAAQPTFADDAFQIVIMAAFDDPNANEPPVHPKWARVLATYAGARVMTTMRLRAEGDEPPTLFGKIIAFHKRIEDYTNENKGTLPAENEMVDFGGLLFETLFQGDVRRLYDEARSRQRGRKLNLILTSTIPWLAAKPWEFCYDRSRGSFLATEEVHFVRNVLTAIPADRVDACREPLRILVVSAQPAAFGALSIDQEVDRIKADFQPLLDAKLVDMTVLPHATPETLHRSLESGDYNIVHFIGHGKFDDTKREGFLVFEDELGRPYPLGQRSVREIFCGRGLSLVFLNSCQSGTGGRADFNRGVAQSLVAHGLPALVANQYSVLDSSASSFANFFYASLAQGYSLGHAAREARIAVNYSMQGELIDWAIPVLYARDADAALCAASAAAASAKLAAMSGGRRKKPRSSAAISVAVWDIDKEFPNLDKTLERMNAAQNRFAFELANISAPLDTWDRSGAEEYLLADRLATRVANKTMDLNVDLLACVTRHPMRTGEQPHINAWWPEKGGSPVGVFSTSGLTLAPEGPDTDRAIINTMVALLTRFFGEGKPHEKGPKSCPLFATSDGVLEHLTTKQKFDADCRKTLRKQIPNELPALDALLKVIA
jgi:hypothetical protein